MRPTLSRSYTSGALAALSLAAIVSASACSPVATVTHAASAHPRAASHNGSNGANGANYGGAAGTSAYSTHVATAHAVKAPAVNAYPWANDQSGGNDAYGETMRQCVSYAAWYINAHGTPFGYYTQGPKGVGVFANASTWDYAAQQAGFTVSTRPVVGSVAQWHAYESSSWTFAGGWGSMSAGGAGHVAIVTRVYSNGNVDLAQYNMNDARSFSTSTNVRAPRYIYVPLASPGVR